MEYGYLREGVATKDKKAADEYKGEYNKLVEYGAKAIVSDHFETSEKERPELEKLINILSSGDVLYINGLTAFDDSISRAMTVILRILDKDAGLYLGEVGLITKKNTVLYSLINKIIQDERKMGIERNYEGKAIAKKRGGFIEGRPRIPEKNLDYAIYLLKEGMKMASVSDKTGISISTIRRELKKRNIK